MRQVHGVIFVDASIVQGLNRQIFTALVPKQFAKFSEQIQEAITGVLAGIGVAFLIPRRD